MKGRMWRGVVYLVLVGPLSLLRAAEIELTMPNVQPLENDLYLCIEKKLDDLKNIVGFKPKASMNVAHHMLIYGCEQPGSSTGIPWNCGEMHRTDSEQFKVGPVCMDPGRIIYAWAMDAPELQLPEDVAFKVGGETDLKYLVLQVHYKDVTKFLPPSTEKDSSGVVLTTTDTARKKTAGVYLVAPNGVIAPTSITYMEAACTFQESATLHPFAFRVHTHKLGKVVSGYRVRGGIWTEIGRRNPQKPQMFYPVQDSSLDIQKGDVIAARCTMQNPGQQTVEIGPTSEDEMCNFYIMYSVSGEEDIKDPVCTSPGPPNWKWNDSGLQGFPNVASTDPDTNALFQETRQYLENLERNIRAQNQQFDDIFQNAFQGSNGFVDTDRFSNAFANAFGNGLSSNYRYNPPGNFGFGNGWNSDSYNYYQEPPSRTILGPYRFTNINMQEVPGSSSQSRQRYRLKNGRFEPVEEVSNQQWIPNPYFSQSFENINAQEMPGSSSQTSQKFRFTNGKFEPVEEESNQQRISNPYFSQSSTNIKAQEVPGSSSQTLTKFRFKNGKFEPVEEESAAQQESASSGAKVNKPQSSESLFGNLPEIPPIEMSNFNIPSFNFDIPNLKVDIPDIPDPKVDIPDIPDLKVDIPDTPPNTFDKSTFNGQGFQDGSWSSGTADGPVVNQYFQTFDDKNGGKGYMQITSSKNNKVFNDGGVSVVDKSSSHSVRTSSSYSSSAK